MVACESCEELTARSPRTFLFSCRGPVRILGTAPLAFFQETSMTRFSPLLALLMAVPPLRADDLPYTRKADVIYHRKWGTVLTMDVFTPRENAKGVGIIFCVS